MNLQPADRKKPEKVEPEHTGPDRQVRPEPAALATHLRGVLGQTKAQLQRTALLSQSLELAIWANHDDEVHYQHQGHHTLSVYLAGGQGSQLKGRADAQGAAGRFCVFPSEHESYWVVREPVQFLHLYVSDLAWAERVVRLLDAEPRSHTLVPQIYAQDGSYEIWAQSLGQLDWSDAYDILQADTLSQQVLDRLVLQSATPQRRQALQKPMGGLSSLARRRVLDYVQAHLGDNKALALSSLAQVASLSEYHFARMFHKSMGCTPHAWVLQCRLARVQQLLRRSRHTGARGQLSLAQLADNTGFSSASHLLRCFRSHFGLTPKKFALWQQDA